MSYGSMIVMVGKRTLNYDEVRKTGTTNKTATEPHYQHPHSGNAASPYNVINKDTTYISSTCFL